MPGIVVPAKAGSQCRQATPHPASPAGNAGVAPRRIVPPAAASLRIPPRFGIVRDALVRPSLSGEGLAQETSMPEALSIRTRTPDDHPDAERRRLLLGLAALAGSACVPEALAQGAGALTPARFAALSTTMPGFAYKDKALAAALLSALTEAVGADALAKIATLASVTAPARLGDELRIAGVAPQAVTVLAALYSGTVTTAKGTTVLTYGDALAWRAVPWTKPNAYCGGQTNYWAKAPGATA
jgi:hypothetical protein